MPNLIPNHRNFEKKPLWVYFELAANMDQITQETAGKIEQQGEKDKETDTKGKTGTQVWNQTIEPHYGIPIYEKTITQYVDNLMTNKNPSNLTNQDSFIRKNIINDAKSSYILFYEKTHGEFVSKTTIAQKELKVAIEKIVDETKNQLGILKERILKKATKELNENLFERGNFEEKMQEAGVWDLYIKGGSGRKSFISIYKENNSINSESEKIACRKAFLVYLGMSDQAKFKAALKALGLDTNPTFIKLFPSSKLSKPDKNIEAKNQISAFTKKVTSAIGINESELVLEPGKSAEYYMSLAEKTRNDYRAAIKYYLMALALEPNNANLYEHIGWTLYNNFRKYDIALEAYESAIKIKPNEAKYHIMRGAILSVMDKNEESLLAYEEAIKLEPKNDNHYEQKGYLLFKMGEYEEAIKAYQEALKLNPAEKRYKEAITRIKKRIEKLKKEKIIIDLKNHPTLKQLETKITLNEIDDYSTEELTKLSKLIIDALGRFKDPEEIKLIKGKINFMDYAKSITEGYLDLNISDIENKSAEELATMIRGMLIVNKETQAATQELGVHEGETAPETVYSFEAKKFRALIGKYESEYKANDSTPQYQKAYKRFNNRMEEVGIDQVKLAVKAGRLNTNQENWEQNIVVYKILKNIQKYYQKAAKFSSKKDNDPKTIDLADLTAMEAVTKARSFEDLAKMASKGDGEAQEYLDIMFIYNFEKWEKSAGIMMENFLQEVYNDGNDQLFIKTLNEYFKTLGINKDIQPGEYKKAQKEFRKLAKSFIAAGAEETMDFYRHFALKVSAINGNGETMPTMENSSASPELLAKMRVERKKLSTGEIAPTNKWERMIVDFVMKGSREARMSILKSRTDRQILFEAIQNIETNYPNHLEGRNSEEEARLQLMIIMAKQARWLVANFQKIQEDGSETTIKLEDVKADSGFAPDLDWSATRQFNAPYRSALYRGGFNARDLALHGIKIWAVVTVAANVMGNIHDAEGNILQKVAKGVKESIKNPYVLGAAGAFYGAGQLQKHPELDSYLTASEYKQKQIMLVRGLRMIKEDNNGINVPDIQQFIGDGQEWETMKNLDAGSIKSLLKQAENRKEKQNKVARKSKSKIQPKAYLSNGDVSGSSVEEENHIPSAREKMRYEFYKNFLLKRDKKESIVQLRAMCEANLTSFIQ